MESIKDKVAIIGMGCTRFGERWDMGVEDLLVEAFEKHFDHIDVLAHTVGGYAAGQPVHDPL